MLKAAFVSITQSLAVRHAAEQKMTNDSISRRPIEITNDAERVSSSPHL